MSQPNTNDAIREFGNALAGLRNDVARALQLERLDAKLAQMRSIGNGGRQRATEQRGEGVADYLTCTTDGCRSRARYIVNGAPACQADLGRVVVAECAEMNSGRVTVSEFPPNGARRRR